MIPTGLRPLRDRQYGLHSGRDYHFFAVELKCVTLTERAIIILTIGLLCTFVSVRGFA